MRGRGTEQAAVERGVEESFEVVWYGNTNAPIGTHNKAASAQWLPQLVLLLHKYATFRVSLRNIHVVNSRRLAVRQCGSHACMPCHSCGATHNSDNTTVSPPSLTTLLLAPILLLGVVAAGRRS